MKVTATILLSYEVPDIEDNADQPQLEAVFLGEKVREVFAGLGEVWGGMTFVMPDGTGRAAQL